MWSTRNEACVFNARPMHSSGRRRIERMPQESPISPGVSSLGSPQQPTTSPLRSFTVVQVAHPKLCCRLDFQAGSTSSIYAIPHSLTDLCADELLLELPRVPA